MSVTAQEHAEIVADVLRSIGTVLANVPMYISTGVDSGLRPESNSLCTPEDRDRIAGELLSGLVEPFRRPGETAQEAGRRIVAESFTAFSPWTWGRHLQRLGEPVCLLAAVMAGRYRDRWPGVTSTIRNRCGYLNGMLSGLRPSQFLPMVSTVVAGLTISRREKPDPAPDREPVCKPAVAAVEPPVAEHPPQESEPDPTLEPETAREGEVEALQEPPVSDTPPPRGGGVSRPLTPEEVDDEVREAIMAVRRGEVPPRIAAAPLEVQADWQSHLERFQGDHREMMMSIRYRSELDRLRLMPQAWKR